MKPGVTYGYAGPVCYCPVDPSKMYQRPSRIKVGLSQDDFLKEHFNFHKEFNRKKRK